MPHHHAPHWEANEPDIKSYGFVANLIHGLGRKEIVAENDLQEVYEAIEQADFEKKTLQNIMLLFGSVLRKRSEVNLRYLGGSLILAAYAELPHHLQGMESSLDLEGKTTQQFAETLVSPLRGKKVFSLSGDMELDRYENDKEIDLDEEGKEVHPIKKTRAKKQLALSGIFAEDDEDDMFAEENPDDPIIVPQREPEEQLEIPRAKDIRLITILKLAKGEELTQDERIRGEKPISMADIRKKHAPDIGNRILEMKRGHKKLSLLPPQVLEVLSTLQMLDDLKSLINFLIRACIRHLLLQLIPGDELKTVRDFFEKNQRSLSMIFHADRTITSLEKESEKTMQMLMQMHAIPLALDTVGAEFELSKAASERNPKEKIYTDMMQASIQSQLRDLFELQRSIPENLQKIRKDLLELFREIMKIQVVVPDPWGK